MFNRFKKSRKLKKGWYDVTLFQYERLKEIDLTDILGQIEAAELLLGINADELTWNEFNLKCQELEFIDKSIPEVIVRKEYAINGKVYTCHPNLNELNVARYIDFTTMAKTGALEKILAVVLIPEGKEYGDYDMDEVYSDILTMSIVDVFAILNFFRMQFKVCIKTLQDYSVGTLKRTHPELARLVSEIMDSYSILDL